MKKMVACLLLIGFSSISYSQSTTRLVVNGYDPSITINRNIYGHFSEHLGRCIYDGFWVNDSMNVPKKDRIRLDVVEA